MPIPESQLETWAHQGAITAAKDTRISIYAALTASTSPLQGKNFDLYLQGSYGNSTNTWASSDVDIVAQYNETYFYDLELLSPQQQALFLAGSTGPASYRFEDFRRDVDTVLTRYYGNQLVQLDDKCVKVRGDSGRQPADVVPCLLLKKFIQYLGPREDQQRFVTGIRFITRTSRAVITNFPKLHLANGEQKNAETSGWYKPTVRMFKNARQGAVEAGLLEANTAPSYFVECLLYNVPNYLFGATLQETFLGALKWIGAQQGDTFVCQNGFVPLFGNAPEQWSRQKASTLLVALGALWDGWGD